MIRTYSKRPAYFLRRLIIACLFVVFAFLLGLVPRFLIPVIAVPLSLQHSAVFFAGSLLGFLGFLSMFLFFLLVALGLPLLSGGRGGIEVFLSPSAGFLFGYVLATLFIGMLVERHWQRISFFGFFIVNTCGLVLLYACGIMGMILAGSIPFVRALKIVASSILLELFIIVFVSCVALWFKRNTSLIISHKRRHIQSHIAKTPIFEH